ncbi:Protein kinase domain [Dillenia turbinata]|uniref:Wee1-like protein kinase n=1 Tax=Dillenia turbinata TaxID=194707 RepID=A0AAN8VNK1_9MAGN
MKRRAQRKKIGGRRNNKMNGTTLASHLKVQLGHTSKSNLSFFQNLLQSETRSHDLIQSSTTSVDVVDADVNLDDTTLILSQDFFCTPDYITPVDQNATKNLDCNQENPCPKSPDKLNTLKTKRFRLDDNLVDSSIPTFSCHQQALELENDTLDLDEFMTESVIVNGSQTKRNYVSQSAVALRCRAMPPPCIKNPYLKYTSDMDGDRFGYQRAKYAGIFSALVGGDGLSRYRTDFHELEQIGSGNFSRVFKVLKRIDGCLYAVKQITRQLYYDTERSKALMEIQALAALGSHENIVGYYSSWFENEKLYIQMELCDCSISVIKSSHALSEGQVLEAMHQIAMALQFIHEKGVVHLDVKPDNIYVKNGIYKLGDFGCATLLDGSLPIEEGDARYMPQEILNEKYDHLDKVDIFSLGAAIYELIRGLPLPGSGPQVSNLRDGKLPLLPSCSLQLQNLVKAMVDPDPTRRPSAKDLVENPIFDRVRKIGKIL